MSGVACTRLCCWQSSMELLLWSETCLWKTWSCLPNTAACLWTEAQLEQVRSGSHGRALSPVASGHGCARADLDRGRAQVELSPSLPTLVKQHDVCGLAVAACSEGAFSLLASMGGFAMGPPLPCNGTMPGCCGA